MTMTVVKTGLKSALDSIDYSKYCGMFLIATEVMRDEFSALIHSHPFCGGGQHRPQPLL